MVSHRIRDLAFYYNICKGRHCQECTLSEVNVEQDHTDENLR